jgi:hypothetical protein
MLGWIYLSIIDLLHKVWKKFKNILMEYIYIYGVFNICWDPYFGKSANNVYLSIYYIIYDFNVFRK